MCTIDKIVPIDSKKITIFLFSVYIVMKYFISSFDTYKNNS